ncbi:response regulator [Segetibacter koreensis]|uniref:response regulator n=1 Tax=Segetibacter koreensis TaxID=398037 RepID=UPI00036C0B7E|nr:response regulator [Segetibacter koreensis]
MLQKNFTEIYPQLKNKVVLNVDDNEMNRIVLSKIMQSVGIKIIHAENGDEAIKKLLAGLKPDVILMDLEMPVMNGVQASEYIRGKIDSEIPIIINSGSVSAYQRFKLNRLNIGDFLEKPYSMNDIFSKLYKNIAFLVADEAIIK